MGVRHNLRCWQLSLAPSPCDATEFECVLPLLMGSGICYSAVVLFADADSSATAFTGYYQARLVCNQGSSTSVWRGAVVSQGVLRHDATEGRRRHTSMQE